ncbi:MAG: NUDIX domain-containing protein [Erysipelotrichaceae bacterium]|nr:NUDIX domain-containing protein [Erysipelotrichaceae bacterium]MDD6093102.1 NUDIX domain-containing protein [bacterium]MDY3934415.1 NUDIX domain-containing protein [Bacilli bacterium]
MEYKHLGVYGLVIKEEEVLLIKKAVGPYKGKLDLPGGTVNFGERPNETLIREFDEETGLAITDYSLFDVDSVKFLYKENDKSIMVHHVGIFYKILGYENDIKENISVDLVNDDSLGAGFYKISSLRKKDLSKIAILELEKLGYELND